MADVADPRLILAAFALVVGLGGGGTGFLRIVRSSRARVAVTVAGLALFAYLGAHPIGAPAEDVGIPDDVHVTDELQIEVRDGAVAVEAPGWGPRGVAAGWICRGPAIPPGRAPFADLGEFFGSRCDGSTQVDVQVGDDGTLRFTAPLPAHLPCAEAACSVIVIDSWSFGEVRAATIG